VQSIKTAAEDARPKGQISRPKTENGVGFLRKGSEPPPHQLGGLWSAVTSPVGSHVEPRIWRISGNTKTLWKDKLNPIFPYKTDGLDLTST